MTLCNSCGVENPDGVQFCTKCGAALPAAGQSTSYAPPPASEYTPTGGAGTYNSPQSPMQYQQPPVAEPMHPAIPAVVSLFFPGAGLFFVPGKTQMATMILIGWIIYLCVFILLLFFVVGFCLTPVSVIIHLAAALYTYDEAAKASGGRFPPLVFK